MAALSRRDAARQVIVESTFLVLDRKHESLCSRHIFNCPESYAGQT